MSAVAEPVVDPIAAAAAATSTAPITEPGIDPQAEPVLETAPRKQNEPRAYDIFTKGTGRADAKSLTFFATATAHSPRSALTHIAEGLGRDFKDGDYIVIASSAMHRLPVKSKTRIETVLDFL